MNRILSVHIPEKHSIEGHESEGWKYMNLNDHRKNMCLFKKCKQYKSILSHHSLILQSEWDSNIFHYICI